LSETPAGNLPHASADRRRRSRRVPSLVNCHRNRRAIGIGSQGIALLAYGYVGTQTGNYSAFKSQASSIVAGGLFGRAVGRFALANGIPGRMGAIPRERRTAALGNAAGNVFGDGAGSAICGQ
jgi:hypothetical protein